MTEFHRVYPNYPRVAVTSIGFPTDDTAAFESLHNAFRQSVAVGNILWFAAAEEVTPGIVGIPGAFSQVVAVGALEQDLSRMTRDTATSPIHPKIELVAPVGDSWVSSNRHDPTNPISGVHGTFRTGTSIAAGFVSGIARLAWQRFPSWTASQLRQEMRDHARDLGAPGRDNTFGYGMPDAICLIDQLAPCQRVSVSIQGPEIISAAGSYDWDAFGEGGDGQYVYTWEYQPDGGGWTQVANSQRYTRWVSSGDPSFRLRATVSSIGETHSAEHAVSVEICGGPVAC